MQQVEKVVDMNDWKNPATTLLHLLDQFKIATFSGDLGAGKTTFIKEIIRQSGSEDLVSSPSFSIVNEYLCHTGSIYHFDLYRIKDPEELWNIGWFDYLDSGNICLIEWPAMAGPLLNDFSLINVTIRLTNNTREITIETPTI